MEKSRKPRTWPPIAAQVAGGVAALAGLYLLLGLAPTLLAGGIAVLALGILDEAGRS